MPVYEINSAYTGAQVVWGNGAVAPQSGVPIGTTFKLTGAGSVMQILDDDSTLQDNVNAGAQTLDTTQQRLNAPFDTKNAGDYVYSRAYQEIQDSHGNVGRIYQIKIGTWNGTGMPSIDNTTYYAFTGNVVLSPGETYTVTSGFESVGNQSYAAFSEPVCFAAGTLISTPNGPRLIESLHAGDLVRTADGRDKPIQWVGSTKLGPSRLRAQENLRPIRIKANALGKDTPNKDLVVSPQHRIIIRSKEVSSLFDAMEVLVAAKHLLGVKGIEVDSEMDSVEYYHILLEEHDIVLANGTECETLYLGPQAIKNFSQDAFEEILAIFPDLVNERIVPDLAKIVLSGREGRALARKLSMSDA